MRENFEERNFVGDVAFLGVDARRDPQLVREGFVCFAENMQFARGVAETRGGFRSVAWGTDRGMLWSYVQDGGGEFPADFLLEQQKHLTDATLLTPTLSNGGVGVVKVSDRAGLNEFEYEEDEPFSGGWLEPEVGDRIVVTTFSADEFNGEFVVSYRCGEPDGGDGMSRKIRVIPDSDVWDAAPASEGAGHLLVCEGGVNFETERGFGEIFGVCVL